MKKYIALAAAFTAFFLIISRAIPSPRVPLTYTMTGAVSAIDSTLDLVYLVDSSGEEWAKYDADDYEIGDPVLITFCTFGTADFHDDIVLTAYYNP